ETDDSFGKPLSITDPLNRTTTYQYDSQENLISVIDAMQPSATTTYTYDTNGFQRSVQLQGLPPDSKTYNQFGGITSQTDAANSNTITTTYDANLNPVQMTDLLNGGGFLGSFTYDSQGNVKSYTDANQKATTFDYDPSGNLQDKIDALGEKTSYTYDAMGKVKTMKDACGNGSCPDITVGTTHPRTYTYDQLERLTDIADPNGVTTHYVYDNNGNKTDEYNAYVNATTFQRHTSYSYDNLNRLTT